MYRGREMARQDMGINTLNRVVEILADFALIDTQANYEGRRLSLEVVSGFFQNFFF